MDFLVFVINYFGNKLFSENSESDYYYILLIVCKL